MFRTLCATDDDMGNMVLRIVLGLVFFPHGAQKALGWFQGHGPEATVAFFGQIFGLPPYLAYLVIAAEFLGAIALILGLFTRVAALGILAVMAGAVFLTHGQYGFFMNWSGSQPGEGIEHHLLAMAIALVLLLRGGGRASLDRLIGR
jgi:putative oxidoreductase